MPGAKTFARSVKGIALASVVIAVVLFAALSAFAAKVTPEFISGATNHTCSEFAKAGQTWKELKVDPPGNGTKSDGTLTVTITNFDTKTFDWSSNIGIDAVFVKAGSAGSYLYRYDDPTSDSDPGEETSDTGLTSPGEGQTNQISHISFCYDVESSPSPSPSPSSPTSTPTTPTPTPSETPSTSPSPSVSPSESESPSPGVSVLPSETATSPGATVLGKKLTRTGADVIRLALFALALVLLGAAAYVISTRTARKKA